MRVAYDQVPVAVDAEPAGPTVAIIRGLPGRAEIFAVEAEHLDAGREVHQEQPILAVNRDRSRTEEVAGGLTLLTPDDLWFAARPSAADGRNERKGCEESSRSPSLMGRDLHDRLLPDDIW